MSLLEKILFDNFLTLIGVFHYMFGMFGMFEKASGRSVDGLLYMVIGLLICIFAAITKKKDANNP